jgi:hypothetical protein
MAMLSSNV